MKKNVGVTKRKLTDSFKLQIVEEVLSGRATQAQLSRRYSLSSSQVSDWIADYENGRLGFVFNSIDDDPTYMKNKIAELERLVGQLTIENTYLKKASEFLEKRQRGQSSILTASIIDQSKTGAK
jgi:transposase-like protein